MSDDLIFFKIVSSLILIIDHGAVRTQNLKTVYEKTFNFCFER